MSPSEKIIRHVLLSFPDVSYETLMGKNRSMRVSAVRWIVMHRLWVDLRLTTTQVGRRVNKDHSTVVHGLHVSNEWLQHCLRAPQRREAEKKRPWSNEDRKRIAANDLRRKTFRQAA